MSARRAPSPESPESPESLAHEVHLDLATGARLTILTFSTHEARWIYAYRYTRAKQVGSVPDLVNDVKLVGDYAAGYLGHDLVLSMHVILPHRLGRQFFAGMDISPGAKTYLEFTYQRTGADYRLVEICKGATQRLRLADDTPGLASLTRPVHFPFPVHDRLPIETGRVRVPFLRGDETVTYFELPTCTRRSQETP